MLLCLGGALAALLAGGYLPEHKLDRGEFYSLILFATFGAMMLAAAGDALTLFLGPRDDEHRRLRDDGVPPRERRARPRGRSSTSSSGRSPRRSSSTASRSSTARRATPTSPASARARATAGGAEPARRHGRSSLVLVGLVFKVSAVPFHTWTPDAYEGAPTPATTFMAVAVKSGAPSRCCCACCSLSFGDAGWTSWATGWPPVIATLAVAHDDGGEPHRRPAGVGQAHARLLEHRARGLRARRRRRRMMRDRRQAGASVLFYLLAYTVSTAGAFGALILCGSRGARGRQLRGPRRGSAGATRPPALAFSLFLLSLAGIPPTAGFFGKWFIFRAAIDGGLYWLAIVALRSTASSAPTTTCASSSTCTCASRRPGAPVAVPMRSGYVAAALLVSAILVLALGLTPTRYLDLAVGAATFGTG